MNKYKLLAQCLHTVTENNPETVTALSNDAFITTLQVTVQEKHSDSHQMLFRMLAAGKNMKEFQILCRIVTPITLMFA